MKQSRILSLLLAMTMILSVLAISPLTTWAVDSDSLILYPADGYTYYTGQKMTFGAYIPDGVVDIAFDLDGNNMGTPVKSESQYNLEADVSSLQNGEHTFTVSAIVGEKVIEKTSTFNLYCDEKTIAYNDFDFASETLNESAFAACEAEADKLIWSFGGLTVGSGNDMSGNKWLKLSAKDQSYPEIRIGLNNKFFGYDKVGANNGLAEGIVITEFDIKMNSASGISLNGSGAHNMSSSSYYGSTTTWRLFNPGGTLGTSSSLTYTYGAGA